MSEARRRRPGRALVVAVVVLVAIVGAPTVPAPAQEAGTAVLPTQWVAKQFTEILGRAPSPTEYDAWLDHLGTVGCSGASLRARAKTLLLGSEMAALYPDDQRAARVLALVRATYNREPTVADWTDLHDPYAAGTRTWAETVERATTSSAFQDVRATVCTASTFASYRFDGGLPLDLRARAGFAASRSQTTLQAALDAAAPSCGTVELHPTERVLVGPQRLSVPPCVTLRTATSTLGAGPHAGLGRLVADGAICAGTDCVDVAVVSLGAGAELHGVWVDARAAVQGGKTVAVELAGSTAADPGRVAGSRVSDPGPGGTGIRLRGFGTSGTACVDAEVSANLVTGYDRGHWVDAAGRAQWSDGISVQCEDATVEGNDVVDVGDWGIGLFGVASRTAGPAVQRSQVVGNRVLSAGSLASVGIGADAIGECRSIEAGPAVPCVDVVAERSFAGAEIRDNEVWTGPRSSFDVALLLGGGLLWGDSAVVGRGLSVTGTTSGPEPARANVGIAVSRMLDVALTGNSAAFTPVTTTGGTTADLPPCPEVAVGLDPARGSVAPGSQATGALVAAHDGCLIPPPPSGGLERLETTTAGGGRLVGSETGLLFTPWGHNYNPDFDVLLDDGWANAAVFASIVDDLREMRQLGTTIVRIHPQLNKFLRTPTAIRTAEFTRLERLVDVADDLGLYVDITGLGIWRPADNRDDASDPDDADEAWLAASNEATRWGAQALFWEETARRLKTRPAVAFYNLMNEPVATASAWCPGTYGGFCFIQALTRTPGGRSSADIIFQWILTMRSAIDDGDPLDRTPITVGNVDLGELTPATIGGLVDLMVAHSYPTEAPGAPDEVGQAVARVKAMKEPGKPLVVEEVGYGAGCASIACLERLILDSRPQARGWIGHTSGLPPADGTNILRLAWLQVFARLGPSLAPCGACQPS